MATAGVIGRERELEAIACFLDTGSVPRTLVVAGGPGDGKTTLLRAAATPAAGTVIMSCWPSEGEAALPFVSLADLLRPYADEVLPRLPRPQRRALAGAMFVDEVSEDVSGEHIIGAAFLSAVELLAASRTVLLVVDDAQWLDAASSAVLTWVLRRLRPGLPVRLLVAHRTAPDARAASLPLDLERAFAPPQLDRLLPAALGRDAIYAIVRERLGIVLTPPQLARVCELSGGNPFYALELARAGEDGLPDGLAALVERRLAQLPAPTLRALGICGLLARPTLATLAAALAPCDPWSTLAPAIDDEVVNVADGAIRFEHPLLAAGARAAIPTSEARHVHRQLAAFAPTFEERAAHRARCTDPPNEETAAALEAAARDVLRRGATPVAADLAETAFRFTAADDDVRARRALLACVALARTGHDARVVALSEEARANLSRGPDRARLLLKAALCLPPDTATPLLGQALDEADGDPTTVALVWTGFAWMATQEGDWARASDLARGALHTADAAEPYDAAEAYALAGLLGAFRADPDAERLLERARELEAESGVLLEGDSAPDVILGHYCSATDRLDEGRVLLERHLARGTERGDELARLSASFHLAELEWRAGRWDAATAHAARADQIAEQTSGAGNEAFSWWIGALVAASRGDDARARVRLEEGLRRVSAGGNEFWVRVFRWPLGFLELSVGRPEAALTYLEGLAEEWDHAGIVEVGSCHNVSDELEALVLVGREADAERRIAEESARAELLDRDRLRGVASRARGMLASRRGDHAAAVAALRQAEALHAAGPLPFDHGRTLLALGEAERRARQVRDARTSLEHALELFANLRAEPWMRRGKAELRRLGGRVASGEVLTATEERVATLVAEGRTNREVADELVVSVRAVEANLTRVYAKLGLRSRAELAARYRAT